MERRPRVLMYYKNLRHGKRRDVSGNTLQHHHSCPKWNRLAWALGVQDHRSDLRGGQMAALGVYTSPRRAPCCVDEAGRPGKPFRSAPHHSTSTSMPTASGRSFSKCSPLFQGRMITNGFINTSRQRKSLMGPGESPCFYDVIRAENPYYRKRPPMLTRSAPTASPRTGPSAPHVSLGRAERHSLSQGDRPHCLRRNRASQ